MEQNTHTHTYTQTNKGTQKLTAIKTNTNCTTTPKQLQHKNRYCAEEKKHNKKLKLTKAHIVLAKYGSMKT